MAYQNRSLPGKSSPNDGSRIPFGLVQVAGIRDVTESARVAASGADWQGIPLRLDVHRPDVDDEEAARIVAAGHAPIVLITYLADAPAIIQLAEKIGVRRVQLHGRLPLANLRELRAARPDWTLLRSVIIGEGPFSHVLTTLHEESPCVDGFITDTFDPATRARGATGKRHDWALSRSVVECSPRPVILAGGLDASNVAAAIEAVQPWGVDAHTRLEDAHGAKDAGLVRAFVEAARKAFQKETRS